MLDLGTLRLGVKVDSDAAKKQLEDVGASVEKTEGKTQSLRSTAKNMIKAFAAAYAVKELVKIGKAAMDAYAKYEQLEGGVEKIFGDKASRKVMKNADKAYKTAGISANKYMEQVTSFSASLIQSLDGDTVKAADVADMAIQDMADNANTFGTSMESIQNAYSGFARGNYTMLDNLKLGFAGSKEGMEQLLEKAEEFSGVDYHIENLNDVYEAIHVIQEEMNIAGTTAKEAGSTIEGSMNAMKASWENLLTAIGSGEGLDAAVTNFLQQVGQVAQNILPRIITIAGSVVKGLVNATPKILNNLANAISNFANNLNTKEGKEFMKAGLDLLKSLLEGLMKAVPNLLKAIGKLVLEIIEYFTGIDLWDAGKKIINSLLSGLKNAWEGIKSWVAGKVSWIKDALTPNFGNLGAANAGADGAHRTGLAEVPYDGYRAVLHKGETVLTAAENNQYESMRSMMSQLLTGMAATSSMSGGVTDAHITINLGGAKVAEQVFRLNRQGQIVMQG